MFTLVYPKKLAMVITKNHLKDCHKNDTGLSKRYCKIKQENGVAIRN